MSGFAIPYEKAVIKDRGQMTCMSSDMKCHKKAIILLTLNDKINEGEAKQKTAKK